MEGLSVFTDTREATFYKKSLHIHHTLTVAGLRNAKAGWNGVSIACASMTWIIHISAGVQFIDKLKRWNLDAAS